MTGALNAAMARVNEAQVALSAARARLASAYLALEQTQAHDAHERAADLDPMKPGEIL